MKKLIAWGILTVVGTIWFGFVYFNSILPALGVTDGWQYLVGLLLYVGIVLKISALAIAGIIFAIYFLIVEIAESLEVFMRRRR